MRDFYSYYKSTRDKVWAFLIHYKITKFPLKISTILKDFNIQLIPYSDSAELITKHHIPTDKEAYTLLIENLYPAPNQYIIFYNDQLSPERMRFTMAHELGHIVLQHIVSGKKITPYMDKEANIFASRLLMPAIVIKHHDLKTVNELAQFFGVSHQAADIRYRRYEELIERDKFLTSSLERDYYELYKKNNAIK